DMLILTLWYVRTPFGRQDVPCADGVFWKGVSLDFKGYKRGSLTAKTQRVYAEGAKVCICDDVWMGFVDKVHSGKGLMRCTGFQICTEGSTLYGCNLCSRGC